MSKIKQVLIMHRQGHSNRNIARMVGMNKCTVNEYIRKIRTDPLGVDRLLELDEPVLEGRLFAGNPAYTDGRMNTFLTELPYYREQLENRKYHMTRQLLWEEYIRRHPDGYGRSQFYYHLAQNLVAQKDASSVLSGIRKPGEVLMIDFAGDRMSYTDIETGERIRCEVFVGTMAYSDYAYAVAVPSQKAEDLIHAIRMCLEYLGGVPESIVPDNLKSAVVVPHKYAPTLHSALVQMGNHYHFSILPARPGHPKDKAPVESQVRRIYNQVYARLRNREFFSLRELNEAIEARINAHNQTRMKEKPFSREECFHSNEKSLLKPLPDTVFELQFTTEVRVSRSGEIHLAKDNHYYSVPHTLVGRKALVIYTRSVVKAYVDNRLVATHLRVRGHGHTQLKEHLSPGTLLYLERSPEFYLKRAGAVSTSLEGLIASMFADKASGVTMEVYYRQCEWMLDLRKKTPEHIFNKACNICRENKMYRADRLEGVITCLSNNDFAEEHGGDVTPRNHENTRGAASFK